MPLNEKQFQFQQYTPAEFENFKKSVQMDGFVMTQNTIDTVSGHLGALVYLSGNYNRNQQVLNVTIKTSPWQSFQDVDVKSNVLRVSNRSGVAEDVGHPPVNKTPVMTPKQQASTTPTQGVVNKNVVVPPAATTPSPKQAPVPVQTPVKTTESAPDTQKVDLKTETSSATEKKPEAAAATPTK